MSGYIEDTETINILAKLLERQTRVSDSKVDDFNELLDDHDEAVVELALAQAEIADLQDEVNQLQYSLDDRADERDAAIRRLGALDALHAHELRRAQGLEDELREANEFLTRLADLAADEDWLGIAQSFGLELAAESEDGTFIPEYLATEADYESAPVGTEVLYFGNKDLGPRMPTYFHTRVDSGWEDNDTGYVYGSEVLAGHARKVAQWGSR